jgi:hypothetical protein
MRRRIRLGLLGAVVALWLVAPAEAQAWPMRGPSRSTKCIGWVIPAFLVGGNPEARDAN